MTDTLTKTEAIGKITALAKDIDVKDTLDYSFLNSTNIPHIVKIKQHKELYNKIKNMAYNNNINLRSGIYAWTLGPSYETKSEIEDIILLGGNAVGMSTVPELIKAIKLGMDVSAISCLTNYGAGINKKSIRHNQVIEVTQKNQQKFSKLITKII